VLGAAAPAHAATPEGARAAARKLAAQGSEAFERRDFERALELFEQASALIEAPTIALMQARTLAELGRLTAAAERYQAALRAEPAAANAAFRRAAEAAARELELLEPRIPTLRVKLLGSGASGAEVWVAGTRVAPEKLGEDQRIDPGSHEVEVKTAAGASSARTVTLAEGAREELVFSLEPVVRVPLTPPLPSRMPASDPPKRPPLATWVTLGSGVAFAGAGVVLGVLALGHKSDLDAVCTPGCPPEYEDDIHAYRVERNLSYLGFALGATGIAAGTYLLVWNEPGEARTALNLSPNGVSLSRSFR
jgi:tetratricopeptide (TPR) repeat protein